VHNSTTNYIKYTNHKHKNNTRKHKRGCQQSSMFLLLPIFGSNVMFAKLLYLILVSFLYMSSSSVYLFNNKTVQIQWQTLTQMKLKWEWQGW